VPRNFSGRCFHQPAANNPWAIPELEQWAASGDETLEAMGANVECDFRASAARVQDLESIALDPPYTTLPLRTRLARYPGDFNWKRDEPAFLQATNDANIQTSVHGDLELVSVFQFKSRQASHIATALPGGMFSSSDFPGL
jgi:hypothetical protein